MMVIMWFSGLRGAIAYALSLHLEFEEETRKVIRRSISSIQEDIFSTYQVPIWCIWNTITVFVQYRYGTYKSGDVIVGG